MTPTRKVIVRNPARLACHLAPEGRSEILGTALAMEVL